MNSMRLCHAREQERTAFHRGASRTFRLGYKGWGGVVLEPEDAGLRIAGVGDVAVRVAVEVSELRLGSCERRVFSLTRKGADGKLKVPLSTLRREGQRESTHNQ